MPRIRPSEWPLWPVIMSCDNHNLKLRLLPETASGCCVLFQGLRLPLALFTGDELLQGPSGHRTSENPQRGLPHPHQAESVVPGLGEAQEGSGCLDAWAGEGPKAQEPLTPTQWPEHQGSC